MTEAARGPRAEPPAELELGGWRVYPSLNRLTRGGAAVRLEPKVMDVLLFLARNPGQVVSKDDIADAVWPQAYLSESVVTRAIAELRRALEDDVRAPRFIETIAKRGYRLLQPAVPVAPRPDSPGSPEPLAAPPPSASRPTAPPPSSPYVVGQWVRGERFQGRRRQIAEILEGPRNGVWVLGARAVGKTSLLKQLEHLTAHDPGSPYFPLFWDLQGSVDPDALAADFLAALAESEDRLRELGLTRAEVEAGDLFTTLGRLRRALRAREKTLLLLWDEVEELLHLQAADPTILRKLRRALQSQEGIRTVMASGPRLWKLAEQRDDTSPFLHGFAPPLYLGPLEDDEARAVVRHGRHGAGSGTEDGLVEELLRRTGNHPSVLQLLCARLLDLGDLERACESVALDPTVRLFFRVDFDLLTSVERAILFDLARSEAEAPSPAAPEAEIQAAGLQLERLGLLRRSPAGDLSVASPLFRRWLREQPAPSS